MPGYVRTAYYGDLASLKREIRAAAAAGRLDRSGVADLAEAIARREVRSARGADALDRIREARQCVRAVEPELRERAGGTDDIGGEALLVLVESGLVAKSGLAERYGGSQSGAFRAVAARTTGTAERAEQRRTFYVDADERVRRAALRAASEAADPADLDALLDAARLDPDGQNRSLAITAVGRIGGPRVALAVKDLWASSDEAGRLAIVEAWAAPRVFSSGGAGELLQLAESGRSLPAVSAAGALARVGGEGAREGRAVLLRAVAEGTTDDRLLAIQLVSVSDANVPPALEQASKSDDPTVRAVALARLLEIPARRKAATLELESMAKGKDGAARQARVALAVSGDAHAVPWLEQDLSAEDPGRRRAAALGLFRLGRSVSMAPALADSDPGVRMSVACSVLGSSS